MNSRLDTNTVFSATNNAPRGRRRTDMDKPPMTTQHKLRIGLAVLLGVVGIGGAVLRANVADLSTGECIDINDGQITKVACWSSTADFKVGGSCKLMLDVTFGGDTKTYCVTKL